MNALNTPIELRMVIFKIDGFIYVGQNFKINFINKLKINKHGHPRRSGRDQEMPSLREDD